MAGDTNFQEIKERFKNSGLDEKIKIYTTTQGLTVDQFKELLRMFPIQHLDKLERAMAWYAKVQIITRISGFFCFYTFQ